MIWQILFLQDGRLVSCAGQSVIKVWDPQTGQLLKEFKGHTDPVYCLAQLTNGWIASGSKDETIRLWNAQSKRKCLMRTLTGHQAPILSLKALQNGNLASCSCDDTIKIWNPILVDNNLLMTMRGHGIRNEIVELGVLTNGL